MGVLVLVLAWQLCQEGSLGGPSHYRGTEKFLRNKLLETMTPAGPVQARGTQPNQHCQCSPAQAFKTGWDIPSKTLQSTGPSEARPKAGRALPHLRAELTQGHSLFTSKLPS